MSPDTSRDSRVLQSLITHLKRRGITRDAIPDGDSFINVQPWHLLDKAFKTIEGGSYPAYDQHFLRMLGGQDHLVLPGTGNPEEWKPLSEMRFKWVESRDLLAGFSKMFITEGDFFLAYNMDIPARDFTWVIGMKSLVLPIEAMRWFLFSQIFGRSGKMAVKLIEDATLLKGLPMVVTPGGTLNAGQKMILAENANKRQLWDNLAPVPTELHGFLNAIAVPIGLPLLQFE